MTVVYALHKFGSLVSLHGSLDGAKDRARLIRSTDQGWREPEEMNDEHEFCWQSINSSGGDGAMSIWQFKVEQ